ncbi:hypothetical protein [Mucilaginibacter paludis]|uniref:hypothetical protein n=1 Tax=Mucilaginibacter paludis TaxID=423351 RepID=UPI00031AF049|nr:hypothetical protein [Mucilaginibacter paludis]
MKLSEFLNDLFSRGEVILPREMARFEGDDLAKSTGLMMQFYEADRLEMPFPAPGFDAAAALWAAQYLYHATQLMMLRNLGASVIDEYLQPFSGPANADAIYSADLILRHLPSLLRLGSGIAPGDELVKRLRQTAAQWPYSSVGLNIEPEVDTAIIMAHPSLKYTYLDRIIQHADTGRLKGATERAALDEILGMHQPLLWPGLELLVLPEQLPDL